jgi:hypothetical protein
MFSVEVCLPDEGSLTERLQAMHLWLERSQFEASTFYYTFTSPGLLFRADFAVEAAAVAFARKFAGRVIGAIDGASGEADRPSDINEYSDAFREGLDDEGDVLSTLEEIARDIREADLADREYQRKRAHRR